MDKSGARRLFIAMPFRNTYTPLLDVIREVAQSLGIEPIQIGEESFTGSIISRIRSEIEACDLVVAIVTEENGNVYYEIGLAHCQSKPVLLLTTNPDSLKFDLRDHRALVYNAADPGAIRDELARSLKAALDVPTEPHAYLAAIFQGSARPGEPADRAGIRKVIEMITVEANLQPPIMLKSTHVLAGSQGLAIEVEDFLGVRVRAIVDVNGLLRKLKTFD